MLLNSPGHSGLKKYLRICFSLSHQIINKRKSNSPVSALRCVSASHWVTPVSRPVSCLVLLSFIWLFDCLFDCLFYCLIVCLLALSSAVDRSVTGSLKFVGKSANIFSVCSIFCLFDCSCIFIWFFCFLFCLLLFALSLPLKCLGKLLSFSSLWANQLYNSIFFFLSLITRFFL